MRDYHPARLPFFARRNSHFDQFEFFAGPVTLARPHLRLATFCATILISSSLLFLSFLVLCDVFSYSLSLSQTLVSSLWYLLYASIPFFGSQWFIPLSDDDFSRRSRSCSTPERPRRGDGWMAGGRAVYIHAFLFHPRDSTSPRSIDVTGEKFVTFCPRSFPAKERRSLRPYLFHTSSEIKRRRKWSRERKWNTENGEYGWDRLLLPGN